MDIGWAEAQPMWRAVSFSGRKRCPMLQDSLKSVQSGENPITKIKKAPNTEMILSMILTK